MASSTITTVIPVFNGAKLLRATLESVAAQTRRPDRLVVLDNCSTDGTRDVVASFRAMPCEWRQNEANLGLFGNLNRALELAVETEYLHFLHADDLIQPSFYKEMTTVMDSLAAPALGFCGGEVFEGNGTPASLGRQCMTVLGRRVPRENFLARLAELQPFYFCAFLIKIGGISPQVRFRLDLPQLGDIMFWAELAGTCRQIVELPAPLLLNRRHPASGTSRNLLNLQSWVLDEWRVMNLIEDLRGRPKPLDWVRRNKLACAFAARAQVKMKMMQRDYPGYATQIESAVRGRVGWHHWVLARLAVTLSRK